MKSKGDQSVREYAVTNRSGQQTTIRQYPSGARQYQRTEQTSTGMKRIIYDQPPKIKK